MKLIGYYDEQNTLPMTRLAPAPRTRGWMPPFAYRCLPLVLANEGGWLACTPTKVTAMWAGGGHPDEMQVFCDDGSSTAMSHFGHGILTFNLTFLFRTEPGWDLLIRGPANFFKDGIAALEGLVETDTAEETATMNWQFTRPGRVVWEENEPFAMLVPQPRGALEQFEPEYVSLNENPGLRDHLHSWTKDRWEFIEENHGGAPKKQGDYANKVTQRKIVLRPWKLKEGVGA